MLELNIIGHWLTDLGYIKLLHVIYVCLFKKTLEPEKIYMWSPSSAHKS